MKTALAVTLILITQAAFGACNVGDIQIKSLRAKFVDNCRTRSCASLEGVAVLRNNCPEAIGIQVKLSGYNAKKEVLATTEFWPASVRNIPPGDYEFSLDTHLRYDPAMKSFSLSVVEVKRWR